MSDCENFQEMISCLLDGELTEEQESALHAHMDSCEECKHVFDAFQAVSHTLSGDLAAPPDALAQGVMFKIRNGAVRMKKPVNRILIRSLAAAACVAIVLFAAVKADVFTGMKAATEAPAAAEDAAMLYEVKMESCAAEPAEAPVPAPASAPEEPEMPAAEAAQDAAAAYEYVADGGNSANYAIRNEMTSDNAADGCAAEEEEISEPVLYNGNPYYYSARVVTLPEGATVLAQNAVLTIPAEYPTDAERSMYLLNGTLYIPDPENTWYVFIP